MKNRNTKRKFYFVQDYEPLFYPASSRSALAEATYRFGMPAIVNTPEHAADLARPGLRWRSLERRSVVGLAVDGHDDDR